MFELIETIEPANSIERNAMNIVTAENSQTMTSREIAELTGKEHKNVLADIRNMLEKLGKTSADFSADLPDAYGRMQPGFKLDRELTLTLVSGYDIPLRHRVVMRLAQLEQQAALARFNVPTTYPEAMRLAADLADQKAKVEAQLAVAAPKAEALDRIATQTEGAVNLRIAAKLLQVPEKQFLQFANAKGFIFRNHFSHTWQGYADKAKAGLVELKLTTVERDDGSSKTVEQVLITRPGLAKLAQIWCSYYTEQSPSGNVGVKKAGRPKIDITGQRFGRWTALASASADGWLCRCDCGTEKVVSSSHLRNGRTKSCGCATSELLSQPRTHGKRHTRAWKIWSGIIQRCNNIRHARYADYGGRGIGVCNSWLKFEGFHADMGDPPEDASIDRIDNELGYNKANCRWASKTQQARNTRVSRMFEIDGVSKSLAEWCEIYGVIYTTAHSRVSRGWSIERALGVTA